MQNIKGNYSIPSKPNTEPFFLSLCLLPLHPSPLRASAVSLRCFLLPSWVLSTACLSSSLSWLNFRPISKCQLNTLLCLHLIPIYLILFKGPCSPHSELPISHLEGGFTLRCLQRLSLPDLATLPWRWSPTGTPVVRPSRSSRTKDSSSQISCACAG